ncbi:UNVERIFIED_CONTAM: hypothetical protein K2H54_037707 [Gekko kuhli]
MSEGATATPNPSYTPSCNLPCNFREATPLCSEASCEATFIGRGDSQPLLKVLILQIKALFLQRGSRDPHSSKIRIPLRFATKTNRIPTHKSTPTNLAGH